MFTTITKLRASYAQQDRVTNVENALKKKFGGVWYSDDAFPMVFIVISNGLPDYQWTVLAEGVHHIPKGWTVKAQSALDKVMPPSWAKDKFTKAQAATFLTMIGAKAKEFSVKMPFYPQEVKATEPPLTASMMAPADLAAAQNLRVIDKALTKLTANAERDPWPFHKSPTEVKVISTDRTKEPTGKVVSKPLPLPSVLKQIRLLVKGHPKMKMEELKGRENNLQNVKGQLVISW